MQVQSSEQKDTISEHSQKTNPEQTEDEKIIFGSISKGNVSLLQDVVANMKVTVQGNNKYVGYVNDDHNSCHIHLATHDNTTSHSFDISLKTCSISEDYQQTWKILLISFYTGKDLKTYQCKKVIPTPLESFSLDEKNALRFAIILLLASDENADSPMFKDSNIKKALADNGLY
jgi:hypothetical protein